MAGRLGGEVWDFRFFQRFFGHFRVQPGIERVNRTSYPFQEAILQGELDTATFNENKYKDKCEQTERLFHETRREKDEQIFNLQRIADRVPVLEEQIRGLEEQNSETAFTLQEFKVRRTVSLCYHHYQALGVFKKLRMSV